MALIIAELLGNIHFYIHKYDSVIIFQHPFVTIYLLSWTYESLMKKIKRR